jgi:hypothetical protein
MTVKTLESSFGSTSIAEKLHWTWVHTVILIQFILQILLLFPFIGAFRAPMRVAAFAIGLLLLVLLPKTK